MSPNRTKIEYMILKYGDVIIAGKNAIDKPTIMTVNTMTVAVIIPEGGFRL